MKKLIAFIGITLFAFSCHDDPPPVPTVNEAQMVLDLKEYTYFKEGSYWVYEDSATGQLDSMFVYYADQGEGRNADNEKYYWFNCFIYSTRDSFEYHHWFHSSWTNSNPYRSKVFRTKTRPGDYVGETILFEYPIIPGNKLYWGNNDTIITRAQYDSVQIGSLVFLDVVRIDQESDNTTSHRGCYFIGKHFGVVEQKIGSLFNWKLIRFQIIQ